MDRTYRFVWMNKKGGPALIQMQETGINMFGVRNRIGEDSTSLKVEKRALARIGHILRMPNERMTKRVTLGWYPTTNHPNNSQTTISYWRGLIKETGHDPDKVESLASNREKWKSLISERVKHLRRWEIQMVDVHRNQPNDITLKQSQNNPEALNNCVCEWDQCRRSFKTVTGLKQHQKRMLRIPRSVFNAESVR